VRYNKRYLKRTIILFTSTSIGAFYSCSPSETLIDKSQLAGHWLTTDPATGTDIILDGNKNFLLLLEDTSTSDTLHFTYKLKGNVITIFYSRKMWISKNVIIKLTHDSLVYRRRGDNTFFH
jgi:hypothetical protein